MCLINPSYTIVVNYDTAWALTCAIFFKNALSGGPFLLQSSNA